MSQRTLVIAECGSCHDGSPAQAIELINVAKRCGANAAKFQFWSSAKRLAERRHAPEYVDVYERYALPTAWLPALKEHCDGMGIEFMATCYLPEDIAVVAPYVSRFKVASFEACDREFISLHRVFDKPLMISTGMQGEAALPYPLYVADRILHCVSAYPANVKDQNLSLLWRHVGLDRAFDGLSDHTRHPWTGALAVAAGATILERHLRLFDTDPSNPDYEVASDPDLFAEYVSNVRLCEQMLGDGIKRAQPSETSMMRYRVHA